MPPEIRASAGKKQEPRAFRAAGGVAVIRAAEPGDPGADGKPKLASFTGRAYTGAPMTPEGWWTPVIIDLAGVRSRQNRPVLRQHDHEQIVGHTNEVKVGPDGIDVAGVFSGQPVHVEKVTEPARNGFQWQMSVGADPVRTEYLEAGEETEVNGRTVTGPLVISRETEIGEVSFVPLGADGDTSAKVSAANRKGNSPMFRAMLKAARLTNPVLAAKYSDDQIDKMSETEAKAALKECMGDDPPAKAADDDDDGDDDEVDEPTETEGDDEPPAKSSKSSKSGKVKANKSGKKGKDSIAAEIEKGLKAGRIAAAKELQRQDGIRHVVAQYGITHVEVDGKKVNLQAHAIEHNWSAEKTELHALRAGRPGPDVGGPIVYVTNQPDMNEAVLEAAILQANRHQFLLEDDSFYLDSTPDGKGQMRRVPMHLQRQTQAEIKARYNDQVQQAAHTHFKGRIGLQQVLQLGLSQGKHIRFDFRSEQGTRSMMAHWHFAEQQAIMAEGASNLSISNVLANVMNKFALQGYLFVEQAWRLIAAIRSVNDFKPTKSVNLLGDVMYKALGAAGELSSATFSDQAFANQVSPTGRIATIPWTHIVNDDLSILQTIPQKIGQGAGLALNNSFWTLFAAMVAGTALADDGAAFFNATGAGSAFHVAAAPRNQVAGRANKMSGGSSALSATSLQTAKALFDNQIDPNGNPLGFDGVKPVILFGPSNWQTATALLQAAAIVYGGGSAALQPNANVWQGMLTPCMSRYIENANYVNSATGWGIFFNPVALAAIEVAFLNGVDTPAVLQAGPDYQFDKLGVSIRGTMPFGVTQQNYRAAVWSLGA